MADKGCFKCGEDGHMSRECPSGGGGGGGGACHKCGEEGHMSRECPQGGGGDNKCRNCRQVKLDPSKIAHLHCFIFRKATWQLIALSQKCVEDAARKAMLKMIVLSLRGAITAGRMDTTRTTAPRRSCAEGAVSQDTQWMTVLRI